MKFATSVLPGFVLVACLALPASLVIAQELPATDDATTTDEAPSENAATLPWTDQQEQLADLPARRMTHARELLTLLSIDDSQLANFTDGEPLGSQDEETVVRFLFQMPRFPLNDLQRWAKPLDELAQLIDNAGEHRADTFLIRGRAIQVERVKILPEVAERLEFAHYYRVTVDLNDSPHSVVLCARDIPVAWNKLQTFNEPIIAYGMFLKLGEQSEDRTEFNFATPHIGWLPTQPNPSVGITEDLVTLASFGMDVSLFDDVRESNRKPITSSDRECFYQLLGTMAKADPSKVRAAAYPKVDLAPLLQDPTSQHGRLMVVRGTARRAIKLLVDDRDIQERFGIDHYYQIDVFIQLGDQVVRLGNKENGESPTFDNTYPVTVCVAKLPDDLPEGADIREEISIPVACFKLWAYKSRFVSSFDQNQLQVSPMFIGAEPRVIDLVPARNPYVGFAIAGGFVSALVIVWIAIWRSGKSDSKFKRDVLARRRNVESGNSLNDAGIEEQGAPDFSQWD